MRLRVGADIAGGRLSGNTPVCLIEGSAPKPVLLNRQGLAEFYGVDEACLFEVASVAGHVRLEVLSLRDCRTPAALADARPARAIHVADVKKPDGFGYYVCPAGRHIAGGMAGSRPVCTGSPLTPATLVDARVIVERAGVQPECVVAIWPRSESATVIVRGC